MDTNITESKQQVEMRACIKEARTEGAGKVRWATPDEVRAEDDRIFFSIYLGRPGEFKWIADFAFQYDATGYGQFRAKTYSLDFINRIGEV